MTEAVVFSLVQCVCLVYEEYATKGTSHHTLHLWSRLSHVRSDEVLTCHLNQFVCRQQSERHEDVCHDACHGCLSRSGVAVEDIMVGKDFRRFPVDLRTHLLEPYDVRHLAHIVLDTL